MDRYRLRWEEAVYEPGEVKAVAYRDGQVLGEAVVRTAGPPAALRLTPDRPGSRPTATTSATCWWRPWTPRRPLPAGHERCDLFHPGTGRHRRCG